MASYQTANHYDEMMQDGLIREHWKFLISSIEEMGTKEIDSRKKEILRLLRENGVTYNVYDETGGMERPWALDILPYLITSKEWGFIEQALIQRAELLDLIYTDIYTNRLLIKEGLLPPELVFSHPDFLRAASGIKPHSMHALTYFAVDLARDKDGRMYVVGDRTQSPSGSGYALENRIVLSRALPSLYRDSHVHRLALFFRTVRNTLFSHARSDNPRVVILTPGPGNETYFEHAYLANYLGFTLVQGQDLVVNNHKVYLRTLDGPLPVDVIFRRVDDLYCDPLELRADSFLGTPGLLQAARTGNVSIINPLGSAFLQSPALLPFLPGLARYFLGQDLLLDSVPTWWCGDPSSLKYVLEKLDHLVIKDVSLQRHAGLGSEMTQAELAALKNRILSQPHLYVAQEEIPLSTAPLWTGSKMEPRHVMIRTFLVSRNDSYAVMPGGLTRVSGSNSLDVSSQKGGLSKDTWILASEPENKSSLLLTNQSVLPITRSGGEVPSRVAENLLWAGRYTERIESTTRIIQEALLRSLDSVVDSGDETLHALIFALTSTPFAEQKEKNTEKLLLNWVYDENLSGSLFYNIKSLTRSVRTVQDRLSEDTWRVVNSLDRELEERKSSGVTLESLERIITYTSAFVGLCTESMTRGQSFRFLDLGRRLERSMQTLRNLITIFVPSGEEVWEITLRLNDNQRTYARRYRSKFQGNAILDLLLLDESNPRSVAFQLVRIEESLTSFARRGIPFRTKEEKIVLELLTMLRLEDLERFFRSPDRTELSNFLKRIYERLPDIYGSLSDNYFRQSKPDWRQLSDQLQDQSYNDL